MVRVSVTAGVLAALFSLAGTHDPGCGGAGDGDGAVNAPCTRAKDCGDGLACRAGVCTALDGGAEGGATSQAIVDAATD